MIARTNVTDFISIGKACAEFGLSAPTLRHVLDTNEHLCFRSIGGHRRVSRRALSDHLGITSPNGMNGGSVVPLALVCRVSGSNQARKSAPGAECSSLEHQEKRVEDFARKRFGEEAVKHASRYSRVGGGLNHEHPVLVQLISDILNHRFSGGYIVCQDSIRLMRFGNGIFSQICEFGNCEIVYVMEVDRTEAETDLSESVLSILCHFTAKASGARAKKILEISVSETDLVRIYAQKKQGMSYSDLAKWCATEGIQGAQGTDGKPTPLSPAKLHQLLSKHHKVLAQLVPEVTNNTEEFIKSHLKPLEAYQATRRNQGDLVRQMDVYEVYVKWCGQKGIAPVSQKKLGAAMSKAGLEWTRAKQGCKCWWCVLRTV